MRPTRLITMATTALASGIASWAGFDLGGKQLSRLLLVPWTVPALLAGVAAVIVGLGLPVRLYVMGRRPQVDRFRAATVLALAKACSLAGSALTGFYGAATIVVLVQVNAGSATQRVWVCAAATLAAAILAVAGRLVEWFCQLPPDERAEKSGAKGAEPHPA